MNGFSLACIPLILLLLTTLGHTPRTSSRGTAPSDSSIAQIVARTEGDRLRISGTFTNGGDLMVDTLAYRLSVRQSGNSGTSTSRQSGLFETQPGRTDTLSVSRVNVQQGDRLHVNLTILSGDLIVAQDEINQEHP